MRDCATTLASEVTEKELKALTVLLEKSGFHGRHLEIGTAAGGTLKAMMAVYEDTERPDFVVVDPSLIILEKKENSAHVEVDFLDRQIGRALSFIYSQESSIKKTLGHPGIMPRQSGSAAIGSRRYT